MTAGGELPGGLRGPDGAVERAWAFRALDGRVEAALAEARDLPGSRPARVSAMLGAALARPAGGAEAARALSVGDRQWLLARLLVHLGERAIWVSGRCQGCGTDFDALLDLEALPVKPAGTGYPETAFEAAGAGIRLRAPTGGDQEAAAGLEEADALRLLLDRCARGAAPEALGADALARLDATLADLSPEVAESLAAACPSCGAACEAPFDLAAMLAARLRDPFQDVHDIAAVYHWSEAEILSLPTARRRRYLRLIDRARGMSE